MAIPLPKMREELTAMLEETFEEVFNPGWAVFFEHDNETLVTEVVKIEPYRFGHHDHLGLVQSDNKHRYISRYTEGQIGRAHV